MNKLDLTQERWNMILDMQDQIKRQQDEIDRLRRVTKAVNQKCDDLELKLMKVNNNGLFQDIFAK